MVSFKRKNQWAVSVTVIPGLFMGLAAGAFLLSPHALAQQPTAKKAPAAAPAKKSAAGTKTVTSAWVKLCENQNVKSKEPKAEAKKRTVCLTHHERFHPNTGQPLISVAIRQISEVKKETLMIMVPLRRLLKPGLFLKVDKEKSLSLPYSYCTAVGCVAEVVATPEIVSAFEKGQEISIGTIDVARRKIGFKVPLTGFSNTYKGPPIDRDLYTKARKEMFMKIRDRQIELAKRAAEAGKKKKVPAGAGQAGSKKTP